MSMLSLRANRRALPVWSAFALVPVVLTGALTLAPRTSRAMQDATETKKDDKTYTIVRAYKANELNHYKIGANIKANIPTQGEVNIVLAMKMKETVKSVKDDGTATVVSEFEEATYKANDMENEFTSMIPIITTTVDKQGHVLTTKYEGGDPQFITGQGAQMMGSLSQPGLYPSKPVKVGEAWKIDTTQDKTGNKNAPKVTGTATLVAVETIDGVQTLKIKTTLDSDIIMDNPSSLGEKLTLKAHTVGISNIEMTTGKLVKASASTESEGPLGKGASELSFALVKEDPNAKPEKKADKKPDAK